VSGCNGGVVIPRGSPRFPPSRPSGYPVPSPESRRYPPFVPKAAPRYPTRGSPVRIPPPFAAPPPRRGHNGKLSVMNFVKMAGTRLVPPHSLAFRPEWYPRAAHPTPRPLSPQRQKRCAAWVPAERSAPARGLSRNRAGRPPASNPHSP
jgi:hypothetical protein